MNATLVKRCLGDGESQPPHILSQTEFSPEIKRPDKLCPYCKKCNASRQRRWKRGHPEQVNENRRRYRMDQKRKQDKELNDL